MKVREQPSISQSPAILLDFKPEKAILRLSRVNLCLLFALDREVKVIKFRGDPSRMSGVVEVRGIVNKDGTISYGEFTQYDNEFGKS